MSQHILPNLRLFLRTNKSKHSFCVQSGVKKKKKKIVKNRKEESLSHLTFNVEMNKDKDEPSVSEVPGERLVFSVKKKTNSQLHI